MTQQQAQLIILSGPERGLRITLAEFPLTMGRSVTCGLCLSEPFISREHAVLDWTDEGVMMTVRARRGVKIGAKTYKAGKYILLDTGDVLALGGETEILFVAAGADPDAALAAELARRQTPSEPAAPRRERQPAAEDTETGQGPPPEAHTAGAVTEPDEVRVKPIPAEAEAIRRKRRTRKLLIALGVYLLVLAGLALALLLSRSEATARITVPVFEAHQIEAMLLDPLGDRKRDMQPNSQEAAKALAEARQRYMWRRVNPPDRYWCVYQYQRYLRLSSRQLLSDIDDRQKYDTAFSELLAEVTRLYLVGCQGARQERWTTAIRSLEAIVGNIGTETDPDRRIEGFVPDQLHPINVNVQKHLRAIARRRKARRPRRRGVLGA